jgi:hypothetical protein
MFSMLIDAIPFSDSVWSRHGNVRTATARSFYATTGSVQDQSCSWVHKVGGWIFWRVDCFVQGSERIDFHQYFYPPVFPASKIAGCRGIIPLLGEFEGATPPQGLEVLRF